MLFQRTFSKVIESVTVEDNDETILQTDKKCHFPHPFSDQTCRPGGGGGLRILKGWGCGVGNFELNP